LQQIPAGDKHLYPKLIDVRTLGDPAKRKELNKLRYEGCVVVVDLLSICHPRLHEAYLRSMLCVQANVMLVQVSSFGSIPALAEVTLTFRKRLDLEFWDRYNLDKDRNCYPVRDTTELERFIINEMPKSLPLERRITREQDQGILGYVRR